MVKIYLVRHCEAEGNKAKIFQGTTDCDISETGEMQLAFLKERFKNTHIDKVYSSPLTRAYKTANAVAEDKDLEIITHKGFIEIDGGVVEGMPFKKIFSDYAELERVWNEEPQNFHPENGESMRQVYDRAGKALESLANDPQNQGKTLLVATHGAVTKCLLCRVLYGDIEKLVTVDWSNNTAVSLLICDDNGMRLEFYNDNSHIPEDFVPADVTKMWTEDN